MPYRMCIWWLIFSVSCIKWLRCCNSVRSYVNRGNISCLNPFISLRFLFYNSVGATPLGVYENQSAKLVFKPNSTLIEFPPVIHYKLGVKLNKIHNPIDGKELKQNQMMEKNWNKITLLGKNGNIVLGFGDDLGIMKCYKLTCTREVLILGILQHQAPSTIIFHRCFPYKTKVW